MKLSGTVRPQPTLELIRRGGDVNVAKGADHDADEDAEEQLQLSEAVALQEEEAV